MAIILVGCASASKNEAQSQQDAETKSLIAAMNQRIESLEGKIAAFSDRERGNRTEPKTVAVKPHPADQAGFAVEVKKAPSDPKMGFIEDKAIKGYRNGIILFNAEKYPEAILSLSSFLEHFADHPLAGSAQFYIGEAYFRQKEYKLAAQEFERVLTSYDRSTHVSNTLRQLIAVEEIMKRPDAAAKHRQLLTSLFPQSPAADSLPSMKIDSSAQEETPSTAVDLPVETTSANEKIKEAVSDVMSKAQTARAQANQLDEPPLTAPVLNELPTNNESGNTGHGKE
jgi:TolA-binding protein